MDIEPELLEKVKDGNEEFRKLFEEHCELKNRVEDLNKMKFLSPEQELEKKQIQKQKLKGKDRMEKIIGEYQANLP